MPRKLTQQEFIDKVRKERGTEYKVIGDYTGRGNPVEFKHTNCGNLWKVRPSDFFSGQNCPICSANKRRISNEDFTKIVDSLSSGNIISLEKYKGCNTRIKFKCLKHSTIFSMTPTSFRRSNYRCPTCKYEHSSITQFTSVSEVKKKLAKKHPNIILLGEYKGTHVKAKFMCTLCNQCFYSEPNSVLRISGCPYCRKSKGELFIESFLKHKKICFVKQKTFEDCRNTRPLPFDFYLPDKNILIEYDGIQHYKPIEFFGGEASFKKRKYLDNIKNEFSISSNIPLIRIPYKVNLSLVEDILLDVVSISSYDIKNYKYCIN